MISRADALAIWRGMSEQEQRQLHKDSGKTYLFHYFAASSSAIQKALEQKLTKEKDENQTTT